MISIQSVVMLLRFKQLRTNRLILMAAHLCLNPALPYIPATISRWAFCVRMREMRGIIWVRRHLLFLNALQSVFKRVIYIVRKTLSRGMKDYNEFAHISNTVDIHSVCRDFG